MMKPTTKAAILMVVTVVAQMSIHIIVQNVYALNKLTVTNLTHPATVVRRRKKVGREWDLCTIFVH